MSIPQGTVGKFAYNAVPMASRPQRETAYPRLIEHDLFVRLSRSRDLLANSFYRPITLEDAARAACISKFHYLRLFERAFGETPHAFLRRMRFEEARRLLLAGDLPVTEICFEVGYENVQSFSRFFHQLAGCPPIEYRRRARPMIANPLVWLPRFMPACFRHYFGMIRNFG